MANICTIDSFCLDVIKNHFYELDNISPNFRIADTAETDLLKEEILEDMFEEKYQTEDKDFLDLIRTYTSYKDDTPLKTLIKKIYTYISSTPFPQKWLHNAVEMFDLIEKAESDEDFKNTIWGEELLEDLKEETEDDLIILEDAKKILEGNDELEKYVQTVQDDIDKVQLLKDNLDTWDSAFQTSNDIELLDWPKSKKIVSEAKDEAKAIRDVARKKFNTKRNKILVVDSKQAYQDMYNMYFILKKLENLVIEFDTQFSKVKRERNILDFSDMEHLALKILQNKEISKIYAEKFEEIAIDEYQDSNEVQECILKSISRGNNMFMVGDVKQSIYKFRQAMPELFLKKYKTYQKVGKENKEGIKIQLFKNFRSRGNVLDFTNLLFENMMSEKFGEVEYNEEEYLNLGATDYEENGQNFKTELDIIQTEGGEHEVEEVVQSEDDDQETDEKEQEFLEDIEIEAKYIAKKIQKLLQEQYKVYDKKQKQFRNICPKDIVILLRSTKEKAAIYEQELMKLNLPVFSDSTQEYLDTIEISTIMNLLKIIDNPMQDIPLVTVLRSPIYGFTDDDLVNIRLSDKQANFYECMQKAKASVEQDLRKKIENFLQQIEQWRTEQEYLALDEFIWKIYIDTGYYNYAGLMPNGMQRQANLKILFERAKQYETASFKGLYNFINFIEKLQVSTGDMGPAKIIGENDDVIRIMSIHKSKGLEFPVVFLANANKQFNKQDIRKDTVLLHQKFGIGAKYIDYNLQIKYDTLARHAVKNKIEMENLAEEMRVLYVALTRAKEKIYITLAGKTVIETMKKLEDNARIYKKDGEKINPLLLKKCESYFEWIWLVYLYNKDKMEKLLDCNIIKKEDLDDILNQEEKELERIDIEKELGLLDYKSDNEMANIIKNKLESKYVYSDEIKLPTKMSVTEIKKQKLEINKVEKINLQKPQFLQEDDKQTLTGAQKGTVMHLCMQKLDITEDYNLEKIREFVDDLEKNNIISQKEKESINIQKIYKFTQSEIWKEMQKAKQVEIEKPFYMHIPAKDIYQEELEGNILVQGMIDLYYINQDDELILLDYKTDYVDDIEELKERYEIQLEIYKRALEESLKRKVDKVYIYSTHFDRLCKI